MSFRILKIYHDIPHVCCIFPPLGWGKEGREELKTEERSSPGFREGLICVPVLTVLCCCGTLGWWPHHSERVPCLKWSKHGWTVGAVGRVSPWVSSARLPMALAHLWNYL